MIYIYNKYKQSKSTVDILDQGPQFVYHCVSPIDVITILSDDRNTFPETFSIKRWLQSRLTWQK